MKLHLDQAEIAELLGAPSVEFPKYTRGLINLANQIAQGTRPRVVGQMSELVQQCPHRDLQGWEEWYRELYPGAMDVAAAKILRVLSELKSALDSVDRALVERWVHDLVIVKSFIGLRFQEAILAAVASQLDLPYKLSPPEDEAKGIDG